MISITLIIAAEGDKAEGLHLKNCLDLKGTLQRRKAHLRHLLTSSWVPFSFSISSCEPEGWHLPTAGTHFLSSRCSDDAKKLPRKPVMCVFVFLCVCLSVCEHPVKSAGRALKLHFRSNTWVTWSAHTHSIPHILWALLYFCPVFHAP